LDTGTPDSLLEAGEFVRTLEHRQGLKVACLEEIAFALGFITLSELKVQAEALGKSDYGKYLMKIVVEHGG
jgi:glucose-1-phosphate thymidylyltransferase